MLKVIKETELKPIQTIVDENPQMGYIVTEFTGIKDKIGAIRYYGKLYAIADSDDIDKLYELAKKLDEDGVKNLIDTLPIHSDISVVTAF